MRTNTHTYIKAIAICAAIAATAAAGFFGMSKLQGVVPIVPGVEGCWRLEGSVAQTNCLSDQFVQGAAKTSAGKHGEQRDQAIIAYVRRADVLAASDPQLGGLCHPAMHVLGRLEGHRAAEAGKFPTFPDGGTSRLCTAGYVHGLSEGYLQGTPNANIAKVFPSLCQQANARSGCAHGIGHALLRAHHGDTWKTAALQADDQCDALPAPYPGNCHDGVYMELAMHTDSGIVSPSEYASQCRAADNRDAALGLACWGYLGLSLSTNNVPMADTPGWCNKASGSGQFTCIEGYGRDLGIEKVSSCENSVLRSALVQRCIEGAVGLEVGSGYVSKAQGTKECQSLRSPHDATYCTGAVKRYVAGRAAVAAGDGSESHAANDTSVM